MWKSQQRLYLDPSGQVSEVPISGGTLLVAAGGELATADAERYGLLSGKQITPPENKARRGKQGKAESSEPEE